MGRTRLALLVGLLGACASKSATTTATTTTDGGTNDGADATPSFDAALQSMAFAHPSIRDVDVLFVIDDAPGMARAQAKLLASLSAFTDTLKTLPAGYPNLHVGVISGDLGSGENESPGCTLGGDRGVLRSTPRGACAATGLPAGQNFFSIIDGKANFDPSMGLAEALACVAVQADVGCQFPHPLASVLRALGLDGMPGPPANAGFLRPGAFLSIILLTNQDDCSAPPDAGLFDPDSQRVGDPLGPLTSFRCAEYGLLCGGAPPSRTMAGTLTGCQSAEDGTLTKVSDIVASLKTLKADPNMILIAALAGPPEPVTVQLGPPGLPNDPSPWPSLAPSCTSPDGVAARPGVRIEQWVYAFGHNGVLATPCDDSYASSLQSIAQSIAAVLGPPCLDAKIATTTGPHGPRPDCTITDYASGAPAATGTPIPSCVDTGGVAPCWTLAADPTCPNGELLSFEAPPGTTLGLDSSVQCTVCSDPRDPRCR
ncbi:MAG TPA: hypothetical protein VLA14_03910 [Polyangia bacterium]|nr:hypothetical protein [Polyangia bacterium]